MGEIIYDYTGNPFVDAGIWAISEWIGKDPEEIHKDDLREIVEEITDLYLTEKWRKRIYSIFPNNPLVNPSVKDRKERYSKFLNELIDEISYIDIQGSCTACGRRDVVERVGKDKMPLTGSKKLINYFSYGVEGADYCPACIFAVQFSPLSFYACGNLLLVHSNSTKLMKYWCNRTTQNIKNQLLTKNFTGCFSEGYKNPRNALFHIIEDIILDYDENWVDENPSINCYYFSNYGQDPRLDIYHVPTPVFRFLAYIKQHEKYNDWKRIVKRGYQYVKWDKVKEEGEYKNSTNTVYNNLLAGKSIIGFFIDRKNMNVFGDWDLFSYYLMEVKNMDEKRIDAIKNVADRLADYIKANNDIKTLNKLEIAKTYANYRNLLRKIIKKRVENGDEEPMFSLDDYVHYLFPDEALGWKETQDLILFRIYEVLHDWLIRPEVSNELIINEIEMEDE